MSKKEDKKAKVSDVSDAEARKLNGYDEGETVAEEKRKKLSKKYPEQFKEKK